MSLNSLPDEIIAKIAKKMPHCDRLNLMATSQKQAIIGQKYRLQYKYGRVFNLVIGEESRGTLVVQIHRNENDPSPVYDPPLYKSSIQIAKQEFGVILGETWSIYNLTLLRVNMDSDFLELLKKHQSKIDTMYFYHKCCFNLTKAEFSMLMKFSKKMKFRDISFAILTDNSLKNYMFLEEDLLSEEVLRDIIPKTDLFCPRMSITITVNPMRAPFKGYRLTDRFLQELIPKSRATMFSLEECITSFTLDGIINHIKKIDRMHLLVGLFYHFGLIIVESKAEAMEKIRTLSEDYNFRLTISETKIDPTDNSFMRFDVDFFKNQAEPPKLDDGKLLNLYQFTILYIN